MCRGPVSSALHVEDQKYLEPVPALKVEKLNHCYHLYSLLSVARLYSCTLGYGCGAGVSAHNGDMQRNA